jgi:hypothetical protein
MTIAFLPIDIDVKLPDEEKIIKFCEEFKMAKLNVEKDKGSHWDVVPVLSRISEQDWNDSLKAKHSINNRYVPNLGEPRYLNNIDKLFPEIPYMLEQLPYKELTIVSLLLQTEYVPHHFDPHYGDVTPDPYEISIENEPHRYNIQLTHHNKNAFFVSEKHGGEKLYPKITKERPCFAFCERYHWHGSDYIGPNKIQLSVFGIVDRIKHKDMIIKNLIKYRDEAIILPNPIDPWDPIHHHS